MEITVKLYLGLTRCGSGGFDSVEVKHCLPEGLTARELIEGIEIPPEDIMIILVNGGNIMEFGNVPDEELHDGDVVEILPSIIVGG